MARYFLELGYFGAPFSGWQKQPNAYTVQEAVELTLSTICNTPIQVVGCGRTDSGVHASQYILHFDLTEFLPEHFLFRINQHIGKDIVFHRVWQVPNEAHARFDAASRSYTYRLHVAKDPFQQQRSYHYPKGGNLNIPLLHDAASMLLNYDDFFTFCKTNHDAETTLCTLSKSEWQFENGAWTYGITSNRFLRGMIRLVVGMCLRVSTGERSLSEVEKSLKNKNHWEGAWSVPADGLYLSEIVYPSHLMPEQRMIK